MQYASATVTGQGISEIIKVEDIKITDGKGSFVIDKIPSGKNRIVNSLFKKWTQNIFQDIELSKQRDELLPLLMNGQAAVNYHLSDD